MEKIVYRIIPTFDNHGNKELQVKMKFFGISVWRTILKSDNADCIAREIEGLKTLFKEQELR